MAGAQAGIPRIGRAAALVLLALLLPGCGARDGDRAAGDGLHRRGCPAGRLDVMVFNIEYGGTLVDFGNVVEAIRRSGAAVVAVEEAYGHLDRLARELGWPHYDRRTHVISPHPLVGIRGAHGADLTLVEVSPGCVVAVGNVHLPSDPSGGRLRRRGGTMDEVLALERAHRLPPLEPVLRDLGSLVDQKIPAFLAGDFNAPSHLDEEFPWPASLAVEAAGFRDSYRTIHRDPRARPGSTWWARRPEVPGWNPAPDAPQTRIDFLHFAGPARVTASRLVGERGGGDVDLAVDPWVSDHRAIVSSFDVEPGPAPALVYVPHQRAEAGEEITVRYHGPGSGAIVRLEPAGETTGGTRSGRAAHRGAGIATIRFPSRDMAPGAWEAALVDAGGAVLARAPFWLTRPGARPSIGVSSARYRTGEAITVRWSDAPGNRWDWVGVYVAGSDPGRENPLLWRHTRCAIAGVLALDDTAEGGGWPLPPGDYRVILGLDDSYVVLAEAPFEVVPSRD